MKRLLITGATGFIGQRLLELLNPYEFEVFTLCRKPLANYKTVICDLSTEEIPHDALNGVDFIIHLAGFAHDLGLSLIHI